ncbi:MAG: FAD-binding oxidoreductase [Steroidobacteraceae bacterium]
MPNPQFTKPWHGVPREQIHWHPTIDEDACIGCGTCVTGCSRLVYRFDFDRKKPVVIDPLNCMVGCTTCANTCPAHAITFPPIESVLSLEALAPVRHAIEDDLLARHDILAALVPIPYPDRIVMLQVAAIDRTGTDLLRVQLVPVVPGECFCEFTPGQYLELWQPESSYLSRAYSVANVPQVDGSIELHIRRVEGGRFSSWAFTEMQPGDRVKARGPLGAFTMRSRPEVPLLFVAGGTGIAPVLALLRQQVRSDAQRNMVLVWGMSDTKDFYALDAVLPLLEQAPRLRVVLTAESGAPLPATHARITSLSGNVLDALTQEQAMFASRDVYAAGPSPMLRVLGRQLDRWGIARERIHMDSFSV